jgi:hypothetical protein
MRPGRLMLAAWAFWVAVASTPASGATDGATTVATGSQITPAPPVGTQPTDPRNAQATAEGATERREARSLLVVILIVFATGVVVAVGVGWLEVRRHLGARRRTRNPTRDRAA